MPSIRDWVIKRYVPEYDSLVQQNSQLEFYRDFFPRFVDPQVVSYQQDADLSTDGRVKEICVMFTDVRGFTKFSQEVSLTAANSFLNNFYDIVVHHTHTHGGIVDKFLGDGTMSMFGALDRSRSYVKKCVMAAEGIMRDFQDMTMQVAEPSLFLGVGIAQGPAMVGTFGNGEFVNFTAIGHTVNLAARVQSCATNNNILVTKEVTEFLEPDDYRNVGKFELKNVAKKVSLYEVTND